MIQYRESPLPSVEQKNTPDGGTPKIGSEGRGGGGGGGGGGDLLGIEEGDGGVIWLMVLPHGDRGRKDLKFAALSRDAQATKESYDILMSK